MCIRICMKNKNQIFLITDNAMFNISPTLLRTIGKPIFQCSPNDIKFITTSVEDVGAKIIVLSEKVALAYVSSKTDSETIEQKIKKLGLNENSMPEDFLKLAETSMFLVKYPRVFNVVNVAGNKYVQEISQDGLFIECNKSIVEKVWQILDEPIMSNLENPQKMKSELEPIFKKFHEDYFVVGWKPHVLLMKGGEIYGFEKLCW